LLARVENAPLAASYRALAESPAMTGAPRVKVLLDSLGDIERERDAFGTSGGADPEFVALTSRATEIGREIQAVAQDRRDALRKQVASFGNEPRRQIAVVAAVTDTMPWRTERDSAQSLFEQGTVALAESRAQLREYDKQVANGKAAAAMNAPPLALLGAAIVFGVIIGFGAAFFDELRRPRVSEEHEVERATGARVLAVIRPRPPRPERSRRLADRRLPAYIDPAADGHQLTYLHVARAGASRLLLTLTGDDPAITGVVASNFAAVAADEARNTVIVDIDARHSAVAAALRVHDAPGIADIVAKRTDWAAATVQTAIGRDRTIDFVPSGSVGAEASPSSVNDLFQSEIGRLSRYYDAIVIVASIDQIASGLPRALPMGDVIICARAGATPLAWIDAALKKIRAGGGTPLGVVLWDGPPPAVKRMDRPGVVALSPNVPPAALAGAT